MGKIPSGVPLRLDAILGKNVAFSYSIILKLKLSSYKAVSEYDDDAFINSLPSCIFKL